MRTRLRVALAGMMVVAISRGQQAAGQGVGQGAGQTVERARAPRLQTTELRARLRTDLTDYLEYQRRDKRLPAICLAVLSVAVAMAIGAGLQPIPLVIGLSLVMPAVVIDAWRNRPVVTPQPDYPVPPPDDPAWDRFSVWRFSAMDEQPEEDENDDAAKELK